MSYIDPLTLKEKGSPQPVNKNNWDNPLDENIYLYMENAYTGDGGFKNGRYLVPNEVEAVTDYEERCNTSYYRNYVKPMIRASLNPVFEKAAKRHITDEAGNPIEDERIRAFLESADLSGNSLDKVVENLTEWAIVYGVNFYGVENFPDGELSESVQENIDNRKFPYVFTVKPYSIYGVGVDDGGNPVNISYFERVEEIDKKKYNIYRYYDDVETYLFYIKEKEKVVFDRVGHDLGVLPVQGAYWASRTNLKTWEVHPDIWDMVRINTAIFNLDSTRMRNNRKQGFSFPYFSGVRGDITLAPGTYVSLSENTSMAPGFASPDTNINSELRSEVNDLIQTLYQLAEQKGVIATEEQSGIAKEWDFRALSSTLDKVADFAEAIEYSIIERFKIWTGDEFKHTVQYNRDYQPDSVGGVISAVTEYISLSPAEANEKEALQVAAKAFASKYAPDSINEMVQAEEDREVDRFQGNENFTGGEGDE